VIAASQSAWVKEILKKNAANYASNLDDRTREMMKSMKSEAGPSSLQSTSHLDPLPASHPLSLKLRAIFDSTSSSSSQSEATRNALYEIEQRYSKEKRENSSRKTGSSSSSSTAVDTEAARNSLSRDAQDSLEESCLGFLTALQVVDEVSRGPVVRSVYI
jgi:UDP-N-acetylglucosamine 2-epimerase